jgi:nucleoside-diphosphate-sugar epimerase
VRLLAPVVPIFRELAEMRYLWEVPVRLDNSRLRAVLGEEPHTPLDLAVTRTLRDMGCIAAADVGHASGPTPDGAARPR